MADLSALLERLADHLEATAERPVERRASRLLGEAEAVATDLAADPPEEPVVATRIGHVADLLGEIEATGDPAADDHLAAARETVDAIRAEMGSH